MPLSPIATAIAVSPTTGVLTTGAAIRFTVTLTGTARVTGTPYLTLSDGATAGYDAALSLGSTLVFDSVVATGQNTADLTVTGLSLNGGSIAVRAAPAFVADASLDPYSAQPGSTGVVHAVAIVPGPSGSVSIDEDVGRVIFKAHADVNGDGLPDQVTGFQGLNGAGNGFVLVSLSGGVANSSTIIASPSPAAIGFGDLNGDGVPDFVVADLSTGVTVYAGRATNRYQAQPPILTAARPVDVKVADLNGDGLNDLIIADAAGGVDILLSNGIGGFQPAVTYALGAPPVSIALATLPGDALPDIVVATSQIDMVALDTTNTLTLTGGAGGVAVLHNDGFGGFASITSYAAGEHPSAVLVADVNGDGLADLIVADAGAPTIAILAGLSGGGFAPASFVATTAPVLSLALGDVNADGQPDIVAGEATGVEVFRNLSALDLTSLATAAGADTGLVIATSAPMVTMALTHDTGTAGDAATNDPTLTGTGEAGVPLTILQGTTVLGTTTVNSNGHWTFKPVLPPGPATLTARQTDMAGNVGTATLALTLLNELTSISTTPASGGLKAGHTLGFTLTPSTAEDVVGTPALLLNNGATASYNAAASTPTSLVFALVVTTGQDIADLQVTGLSLNGGLISAAGVPLDCSAIARVPGDDTGLIIKTTATKLTAGLLSDSGASATDGITRFANISGTTDPFASVMISEAGTSLQGTTVALANGSWAYQPVLADGSHTLLVHAVDVAGNTASTNVSFTLVTAIPSVTVALAHDTGIAGDRITSDPSLTGTALPGTTVVITNGTTTLGSTTAWATDGSWSFTPSLADGTYSLTASDTDIAGNVGTATLGFTQRTARAAITLALANDSGIAGDRITNDTRLAGTGAPSGAVVISLGATILATATVGSNGTWTASPTLGDGSATLTATITDLVGNVGAATLSVTVDTLPPVVTIALSDDTGVSATDTITTDQALHGQAEPGRLVTISDGALTLGTATANATTGDWIFTPSLTPGSHVLTASQTDVAGNTGTASLAFTLQNVLSGLTATPSGSTLGTGDTIIFRLAATSPQQVTGSPYLQLSNGTKASYDASRSTASSIAFSLTVAPGQDTADLVVTGLALNGGAIGTARPLGFGTAVSLATVGKPLVLATADLNGDGHPDLIVGDASGGVAVLLGDGQGGFGPTLHTDAGPSTSGILVTDLSGDGIPDVVVAANNGIVHVLLGDGSGRFGADATYVVGGQGSAIAIADLNGDQVPDLVVTDPTAGAVDVLLGERVAYADLNGDGITDLVIDDASGGVDIRLGDGTGGFAALLHVGAGPGTSDVMVGDLNGDGHVDLVVAATDGTVHELMGDGSGGFTDVGHFAMGSKAPTLALADRTADQVPDVVVTNSDTGRVTVLPFRSAVAQQHTVIFQQPLPSSLDAPAVALATGDFNRDGHADIAVVLQSNFADVLLGTATGAFTTQTVRLPTAGSLDVAVGDLNADGIPDLVISDANGGVTVRLGNGDGSFIERSGYVTLPLSPGRSSDGINPGKVTIADVNGDGIADIIVAGVATGVAVLLGNGDGSFGAPVALAADAQPEALVAADFNGDGRTDLVVSDVHGGLYFLQNTTPAAVPLDTSGIASLPGADTHAQVTTSAQLITMALVHDTGDSTTDRLTSDPTLVGTAQANAVIAISNEAAPLGTTTADANGAWSFTPTLALDRAITLTARETAIATANAVTSLSFTLDRLAPTVTASLLTDTGFAGDGITTIATLTGTAESNRQVIIANGASILGTTQSDAGGHWQFTPLLPLGKANLTVRETDAAGNTGSTPFSFTLENGATGIASAASSAGGYATGKVRFTVTTSAAEAVQGTPALLLGNGGSAIWNAAASTATSLAFDYVTQPGQDTADLTVVGLVINGSAITAGGAAFDAASLPTVAGHDTGIAIVTTKPVVTMALARDTGASAADGVTTNAALVGTADANAVVTISSATGTLGTATTDANGHWSFTPSLGIGQYALTASDTNGFGNIGTATLGFTLENGTDAITASPTATPLKAGRTIDFSIATTAPEAVFGTPLLSLSNGTTASYNVLASSLSYLVFTTTIAPGHDTSDLRVTGLSLNGGAIGSGGGPSFTAGASLAIGAFLGAPVTADFNGDGKLDLLVAGAQNGVSIALGDGHGGFGATTTIAAGAFVDGVAAADLNGDGAPDIVAADLSGFGVDMLLNDGQGGFGAPSRFFTPNSTPDFVQAADLNGDGKTDIVAMQLNGSVSVLLGDGHGGFAPSVAYTPIANAVAMLLGDFNGNGRQDIMVLGQINGPDVVAELFNNGDGTFTRSGVYFSANGTGPVAMTAADVNGDGRLDLLLASADGTLSTVLNTGDASFGFHTFETAFNVGANPRALTSADVNGDGHADLIVTNSSGVTLYLGRGDGSFQAGVTIGPNQSQLSTLVSDINGDNRPDLLVQGAGVQVLLNSQSFTSSFDPASITTALGSDTGVAIDTIAPVVTLSLVSDTGVSASDGITANPALQGQAEAFGTVTISQGGVTLGTTAASSTGAWSFTPSLSTDGLMTLSASESDAAGNIGTASLALTLDRQAPIVTLALAQDTGVSNSDGITSNPLLVGTSAANSSVTIHDAVITLGNVTADESGHWSFAPRLLAGIHHLTASQTDVAGNTGIALLPVTLQNVVTTITTSPAAGTLRAGRVLTLTLSTNVAEIVAGGIPTLTLNDGGTASYVAASSAATSLVFTTTISQGQNVADLLVTGLSLNGATILSGGVAIDLGTVTADTGLAVNTLGPAMTAALVSDTGASATDFVTRSASITGTGAANRLVTLTIGTTVLGTATSDAAGVWSITPVLADGSYELTATETDIAGNIGTAVLDFVLDTQAPTLTASLLKDTGTSATDHLTTIATVTGSAEPARLVTLSQGGTTLGTTTAGASGAWSITPSLPLGPATVTASQTDLAGNTGTATLSLTVENGAVSIASTSQAPLIIGSVVHFVVSTVVDSRPASGIPALILSNGGRAVYSAAASTAEAVAFDYVVLAGQSTTDLRVTGLAQNGAVLGAAAPLALGATSRLDGVPGSIAAGDVDGDGRLDLLVANSSTSLSLLLGDGAGGFAAPIVVTTGFAARAFVLADVNGDGRRDLVAVSNSSTLEVMLGDGAGGFGTAAATTLGANSMAILNADLNGDGIADLVVPQSFKGEQILLGNGSGGFSTAPTYVPGGSQSALLNTDIATSVLADVNGDGVPDLVLAIDSTHIGVALGNGIGGFGGLVSFFAGPGVVGVAAADLNGDGIGDLVAVGSAGVTVLLSNGNSGYAAPVAYTTTQTLTGVSTADLNGDGRPEIITVGSGGVSVLVNNGAGGFGAFVATSDTSSNSSVTTLDLAGNGRLDILAYAGGPSEAIQNNTGTSGVFDPTTLVTAPGHDTGLAVNATPPVVTITLAHDTGASATDRLTSDPRLAGTAEAGRPVVISNGAAVLGTTLADGTGAWSFTPSLALPQALNSFSLTASETSALGNVGSATLGFTLENGYTLVSVLSLAGGSVNAGKIVRFTVSTNTADPVTGSPRLLLNDGANAVFNAALSSATSLVFDYTVAAGQNVADLKVTGLSLNGGVIGVAGGFSLGAATAIASQPSQFGLAVADLNGDGKADLVTASNTGLDVQFGDGAGGFAAPVLYSGASNIHPRAVVALDLNGDGTLDLAEADSFGTVTVRLGSGAGAFGTAVSYAAGTTLTSIATADFNGDGKADLVVGNQTGGIDVLLGNGSGGLGTATTLLSGTQIYGVATADVNGDGKMDIVAVSPSGVALVLLGNGTGGFGAATSYATGTQPGAVTTADLNGDGRPDLIVANFNSVAVLLNNGSGGFGPAMTTAAGGGLDSVTTADLNNDGQLDVVVGGYAGMMVLLGDGQGGLGAVTTIATSGTAVGVATAHLNGDGKRDLLAAGISAGVAVVLNTSTIANLPDPTTFATAGGLLDTGIQVDTIAPVVTMALTDDTGRSASDRITHDAALGGTAEALDVTISQGGTTLGTAAVVNGHWSISAAQLTLGDGLTTLTASETDPAGNVGTATLSFTLDTQAPAVPVLSTIPEETATGYASTGMPGLTGQAEAGSLVSLFDGSNAIATALADAAGAYRLALSAALVDGAHSLSVSATDVAGNVSARSAAAAIIIDTLAPVPPAAPVIVQADLAGIASTGLLTVSGAAEPGSTVRLRDGCTQVGPAVIADLSGQYAITLATPLGDGGHSLTVTATDQAGNISAASAASVVLVETALPPAPPAPVIAQETLAGYANTGQLTITGVAQPDSVVTIYDGVGTLIGSVQSDLLSGAYSYQIPPAAALVQGSHSLSVTATNLIGTSGRSAATAVIIDTQAPATPSAPAIVEESSAGTVVNRFLTATGTAEPGTTVSLFDGGVVVDGATGVADAFGRYRITAFLPDGAHSLAVSATDHAGNNSALSVATPVVTNPSPTLPPTAPLISEEFTAGYARTGTLHLQGTADDGSTVALYDGLTPLGITTLTASFSYAFDLTNTPLPDGSYNLNVVATDPGGSVATSPTVAITIDTARPSDPTGVVIPQENAAGYANSHALTVTGTADPGSIIVLSDAFGPINGTMTIADASGHFSIPTPLAISADGPQTYCVEAMDPAGNLAQGAPAVSVIVDTIVPVAPNAPIVLEKNASGFARTGKLDVTGAAEAGSTVTLFNSATQIATVVADAITGAYAFHLAAPIGDGAHSLHVTATDLAGNVSTASADTSVLVNSTPPAAPVIVQENAAGTAWTGLLTATGTVAQGSTVDLWSALPGATSFLARGVADAVTGAYRITLATALADGTQALMVYATDAQNPSTILTPSSATAVTIDTLAPAAPTGLTISGENTAGYVKASSITVSGLAEAGSTVAFYDGTARLIPTAVATLAGTFTITLAALAEGAHSLTSRATDLAGNVSTASAATVVTVDTHVPATPAAPSITGESAAGTVRNNSVTLTGAAELGSIVSVYDGTTLLAPTTVASGAGGTYSITLSAALTEGGHSLSVKAIDVAGTTSAASAATSVIVDTQAPATPLAPRIVQSTIDGYANTGRLTLTGSAEAGSTVQVFNRTTSLNAAGLVDTAGHYSVTLATALADGGYDLDVTATDIAGNVSAASARTTVVIDSHVPATPATPIIMEENPAGYARTGVLTVASTVEQYSRISVLDGSTVILSGITSTALDGHFQTVLPALGDGRHVITVVGTDLAGTVVQSAPTTVIVDTMAPSTPAAPAVTGFDAGGVPILTGLAEIGATIVMSDSGRVIGPTLADASGAYSLLASGVNALNAGVNSISITATDAAGNSATSPVANILLASDPNTIAAQLASAQTMGQTSLALVIPSTAAQPTDIGVLDLSGYTGSVSLAGANLVIDRVILGSGALELGGGTSTITGISAGSGASGGIRVDATAHWTLANTSGPVNISGVSVQSGGSLTVLSSDISIAGVLVVNGSVLIDPSHVVVASLAGAGSTTLDTGSTLEVQGAVASGQTIDFTGAGAALVLDQPQLFSGTLGQFMGAAIDLAARVTAPGDHADLAAGNLLVLTQASGTTQFQLDPGVSFTGQSFSLAPDAAGTGTDLTTTASVTCFAHGTRITTRRGEIAVEKLKVGDMVPTAEGGLRPIVWIGQRTIDCSHHPFPHAAWPIAIRAGALGQDLPRRDLFLSPEHAIFAEGVLIPARELVNGTSIVQQRRRRVTYWHIELDEHDVLFAEGLPVESYLENGNRDEFEGGSTLVLHPMFLRSFSTPCARTVTQGAALDWLRHTIDRHATALHSEAASQQGPRGSRPGDAKVR